jgi:hypothetical protein
LTETVPLRPRNLVRPQLDRLSAARCSTLAPGQRDLLLIGIGGCGNGCGDAGVPVAGGARQQTRRSLSGSVVQVAKVVDCCTQRPGATTCSTAPVRRRIATVNTMQGVEVRCCRRYIYAKAFHGRAARSDLRWLAETVRVICRARSQILRQFDFAFTEPVAPGHRRGRQPLRRRLAGGHYAGGTGAHARSS